MNYEQGKQHMMQIASEAINNGAEKYSKSFYPDENIPSLVIEYPGYKPTAGDYRMLYNNKPLSHPEICEILYSISNGDYEAYVCFLDAIYQNGTSVNLDQFSTLEDAHLLMNIIFWVTLQDEINYPQPRYKGHRLPFCRYFEAVYAANNSISLYKVQERCNNRGAAPPTLWDVGFSRPSFYHI